MSLGYKLKTQALRAESFGPNCGNVGQHQISGISRADQVSWQHTGRLARTISFLLGREKLRGVSGRLPPRNWQVVHRLRPRRRSEDAHGHPNLRFLQWRSTLQTETFSKETFPRLIDSGGFLTFLRGVCDEAGLAISSPMEGEWASLVVAKRVLHCDPRVDGARDHVTCHAADVDEGSVDSVSTGSDETAEGSFWRGSTPTTKFIDASDSAVPSCSSETSSRLELSVVCKPRRLQVTFGEVKVLHHTLVCDDSKLPSDGLAPVGLGDLELEEHAQIDEFEGQREPLRRGVGIIPPEDRRQRVGLKRQNSWERIEEDNARLKQAQAESVREHIVMLLRRETEATGKREGSCESGGQEGAGLLCRWGDEHVQAVQLERELAGEMSCSQTTAQLLADAREYSI